MEKNELMMEVQDLARQAEQIEQHVQFLDQQAEELMKFKINLDNFEGKVGSKLISSFGKGVFMETELKSNILFVEVGSGILVKKDKNEVSSILDQQIKVLRQSRNYFGEQFQVYTAELQKKMNSLENEMQ